MYKLMFCTFIFGVLLLKYFFPTGDQLQKYCALDFVLQQPSRLQLLLSYSQFCPNFVGMAMGSVREKCNWQHSMAHPRKPPSRRKNLAKIYASRVTAYFFPNFVAMATGVGRGKMQLAAFDGPSPKISLQAQKSRKNLLRKPSYSLFCPKFRCHGNQEKSRVKLNDIVRFAMLENYTVELKITTLSYTEPKL